VGKGVLLCPGCVPDGVLLRRSLGGLLQHHLARPPWLLHLNHRPLHRLRRGLHMLHLGHGSRLSGGLRGCLTVSNRQASTRDDRRSWLLGLYSIRLNRVRDCAWHHGSKGAAAAELHRAPQLLVVAMPRLVVAALERQGRMLPMGEGWAPLEYWAV